VPGSPVAVFSRVFGLALVIRAALAATAPRRPAATVAMLPATAAVVLPACARVVVVVVVIAIVVLFGAAAFSAVGHSLDRLRP
jgi:hypothetical protein